MIFEYRIWHMGGSEDDDTKWSNGNEDSTGPGLDDLEYMASEGWELIAIVGTNADKARYFFKREKL